MRTLVRTAPMILLHNAHQIVWAMRHSLRFTPMLAVPSSDKNSPNTYSELRILSPIYCQVVIRRVSITITSCIGVVQFGLSSVIWSDWGWLNKARQNWVIKWCSTPWRSLKRATFMSLFHQIRGKEPAVSNFHGLQQYGYTWTPSEIHLPFRTNPKQNNSLKGASIHT